MNKRNKPPKVRVCVMLEPEVKQKLRDISRRYYVTQGDVLRVLVDTGLAVRKNRFKRSDFSHIKGAKGSKE